MPWRREWLPTPVFLPEESHGQRSLAGYSPWSHKELDTTEWLTHILSPRSKQVSFSSSSADLGVKGRSVAAFPQLKAFISQEKNILGSRWCFVPVLWKLHSPATSLLKRGAHPGPLDAQSVPVTCEPWVEFHGKVLGCTQTFCVPGATSSKLID